MYRVRIDFHNLLNQGGVPIPYCLIQTALGYRAYAKKKLLQVLDKMAYFADGIWSAGGTVLAGAQSLALLEVSDRVLGFGNLERTISPQTEGLLTSFQSKQSQHISISFDNGDRYFSRLLPKEPFLGANINIYLGFDYLPPENHLSLFKGTIAEIELSSGEMTIEADER